LEFAKEGAKVVIGDLQIDKAKAVCGEIEKLGSKAVCLKTDVGQEADVNRLVAEAVKAFGGVDILVNNAAAIHQAEAVNTEVADWDRIIRNNLRSVFLCSKAAAKQMIKQGRGGKIVSMSSIHAVLSEPQCCAYTAAKGGVEAFSRTLATELAKIAQPEWIARGVLFLATEDACYMTGSVLTVDGGYVMDGSLPGAKYWTE
jgi:NAD(P)-dependent dehydrogenase (short-subunit alcohol dehydrogenase family)